MSVRPLRPDTDRSLGEPLPHQLANRTRAPLQAPGLLPALISPYLNEGCHAVLALLSEGYPPLKGRSPTRYSPVCHSTHGLLHFRVRLACVRHAASVDSEPGSNSQVKFELESRFNGSVVSDIALYYVKLGVCERQLPVVAHLLILDGLCLHVLSSFQRTG